VGVSTMTTTRLRLHRDKPVVMAARGDDIPATFQFPAIPRGRGKLGQAQRQVLVAGRIDRDESENTGADRRPQPPRLKLTAEDGTVCTPALVADIERTLQAMQARLNRLKKQAEEPYKFPVSDDDDDHRPTAA
jgi:hypothetical protein